MNTETKLREWSLQFDQFRSKVRRFRVKGLALDKEEHIIYMSNLKKIQEAFESVKASNASSRAIPQSEVCRRDILISNLEKEIKEMMATSRAKVTDSSASNLGQRSEGGTGGVITNPITLSERGLIQRQQATMREQDEMIGEIGSGVGRLHQQALEMGRESNLQSRLVDTLESDVEVAADDLREEARHANEVREKTKMFGWYVCLFIEIALVIILLVVVISNGGFRSTSS